MANNALILVKIPLNWVILGVKTPISGHNDLILGTLCRDYGDLQGHILDVIAPYIGPIRPYTGTYRALYAPTLDVITPDVGPVLGHITLNINFKKSESEHLAQVI